MLDQFVRQPRAVRAQALSVRMTLKPVVVDRSTLSQEHAQNGVDFIGHLGGDDFIALFQSPDWEPRCRSILERFDVLRLDFFSVEHREAGGYLSEDRRGNPQHHDLVSLSIGAVQIDPAVFRYFQEVMEEDTAAKLVAKRQPGSSLFVGRCRRPAGQKALPPQTP